MTPQRILETIAVYRKMFERRLIPQEPQPLDAQPRSHHESRAHCHDMLEAIERFVREGKLEKAFRWLGFVQGVLWASGCRTIAEMRSDNIG